MYAEFPLQQQMNAESEWHFAWCDYVDGICCTLFISDAVCVSCKVVMHDAARVCVLIHRRIRRRASSIPLEMRCDAWWCIRWYSMSSLAVTLNDVFLLAHCFLFLLNLKRTANIVASLAWGAKNWKALFYGVRPKDFCVCVEIFFIQYSAFSSYTRCQK